MKQTTPKKRGQPAHQIAVENDLVSISLRHASSADIAHFAYLLIKEAGICVRCLHAMAKPRRVLCEKCLRYWRQR